MLQSHQPEHRGALFPYFQVLRLGLRKIFSLGQPDKPDEDKPPATELDPPRLSTTGQEVFVYYCLIAVLFLAELFLWFNLFDSFLKNYLEVRYNLSAKVSVRAVIFAVLVTIVLFNALKLLAGLFFPFTRAISLVQSLLGVSAPQQRNEELSSEILKPFKKLGTQIFLLLPTMFTTMTVFYLASEHGVQKAACAETGDGFFSRVEAVARCFKHEVLSYEFPAVSLVIFAITALFALAIAMAEVSLFRANFGRERPQEEEGDEPQRRRYKTLILTIYGLGGALLVLCTIWALLANTKHNVFELRNLVIFIYATTMLIVLLWAAARFKDKGTIAYYLRILTIFMSVLINSLALDVILYEEPINHLFGLYQSKSISQNMQRKLVQIGDVPPSPSEFPVAQAQEAPRQESQVTKGELWSSYKRCLRREEEEANRDLSNKEPTSATDARALEIERKEIAALERKYSIAPILDMASWDAVTCYEGYFLDQKQRRAALCNGNMAAVLRNPDLYWGKTKEIKCAEAIGADCSMWCSEFTLREKYPGGPGGRSARHRVHAFYYRLREQHCARVLSFDGRCRKEAAFRDGEILHQYLTSQRDLASAPRIEVTNAAQYGPELEYGWLAPSCRPIDFQRAALALPPPDARDRSDSGPSVGEASAPATPAEAKEGEATGYGLSMNRRLLTLLYKNELCISRFPSLVERNRYKEELVALAPYEEKPFTLKTAKNDELYAQIDIARGRIFGKTEVIVILLATVLQILVILSKLIISKQLYREIRRAYRRQDRSGPSHPGTDSSAEAEDNS